MKNLLLASVVLVAACSGSSTQSTKEALITACSSYATALSILAPQKASMAPTLVANIDKAVSLIGPICTASVPPTDIASALAVVQAELPAIVNLVH